MEGHILSGNAVHGEDAAVLRGAFFHDGNQLQFSAHPQRENADELVRRHASTISIYPEGAAGDNAFSAIAGL